jgi:hypothetical protein
MALLGAIACAPPDTARKQTTAIETDTSVYTLTRDSLGWGTSIRYSFTNSSADTMYAVNCNGSITVALERKEGTEWQTFWAPLINGCLTPPIVTPPGTGVEARLELWGAPPGGNVGPEFRDTIFDGTYRLVWWNLVTHYNTDSPGFGDTIPLVHRVSNEFTLKKQ